jgi:hypothetical protein
VKTEEGERFKQQKVKKKGAKARTILTESEKVFHWLFIFFTTRQNRRRKKCALVCVCAKKKKKKRPINQPFFGSSLTPLIPNNGNDRFLMAHEKEGICVKAISRGVDYKGRVTASHRTGQCLAESKSSVPSSVFVCV